MTDHDNTTFFRIIQERNSLAGVKRSRKHRPSASCSFDGCVGWAWAQGYCGTHYQKLKREGAIQNKRILNDPIRRFFSKIEVNSETLCWEWQGKLHPRGYAIMGIGGRGKGVKSHRFSYQLFYGQIPPELEVMHSCDNRKCSNPAHLSLGTGSENMRDAAKKGRLSGKQTRHLSRPMISMLRILYARGMHSYSTLAWIYGIDEETARRMLKGETHPAA